MPWRGVSGARVGGLVPLAACALLVPVVDAPDKGRDELHARLRARCRLIQRKQQREVAVDAAPLQATRGAYALPRRGNLDEHTQRRNARCLVQLNEALGARVGGILVKGKARIHLGGHAPGNEAQDFAAKAHQQPVGQFIEGAPTESLHRLAQQRRVLRLLHRAQDERGIRCRVLRLELGDLLEVARVGHDGGELFECVKLVHRKDLKKVPRASLSRQLVVLAMNYTIE